MSERSLHMSNLFTGVVILIACGIAWIFNDYQLRNIRKDLQVKPIDVLHQVEQLRDDLDVKPRDVLRAVEDLSETVRQLLAEQNGNAED